MAVRVLDRLEELFAIGGGVGANRLGGSPEEDRAHELVARWLVEAGLEVEVDQARNLYGRLRGRRPELPEVWVGSHLDTVPDGGRFDGSLGVVGGLEAIERAGQQERTLTVVAFRDEEGCRGPGCVGSRAAVETGFDIPPACFVELHIEQGPRLEERAAPVAIVTGIVAMARGEVVFEGRAGHAGTTPMAAREDALVAAAEFVQRLREAAAAVDGAVATVGRIEVEPGASNVIPGRAVVSVDVRAPDRERLDAVLEAVPGEVGGVDEIAMAAPVRGALRRQVERAGLPVVEFASGAGHDAGVLAAAGVPTGMLFVRSLNAGISHSPDELSSDDDVEQAVIVLARALAELASLPAGKDWG